MPQTQTSSSTLFQQCLASLFQLEQKDILAPDLEALQQRIETCTDPKDWDDRQFDSALYLRLINRLQELEQQQYKLQDIMYRLDQLHPVKTAMPHYI